MNIYSWFEFVDDGEWHLVEIHNGLLYIDGVFVPDEVDFN